jgi:D-alanyl-lipoteichoic acid acyltransferase DltB (MBOAT superfamily)
MTFGSPGFALFTGAVLAASAALGRERRWIALLAASYVFYAAAASLAMVAALAGITAASYLCALAVERHAGARRGLAFWAGALATVGPLLALKYAGAAVHLGATSALGLSYYTLQALAYLLDVRGGVVPAERHLGRHALALAFFPKIVQGPIERAGALLPQLADPPPLRIHDVVAGALQVVWGLFQKNVVADRLAPFVGAAFSDVRHHAGLPLLVATYLYAAQLYLDFAGYTDVALGVGHALGIRLTPNFAAPYLARSVAEFWRRWHISLSSWLLDHVFRPLQLGLRDWRTWGTPAALVVTFVVSGLWHGAGWTFLAWGLLHGIYLAASVLYRPLQRRWHRALRLDGSPLLRVAQVVLTFHLVCLGWILFRAPSLRDAAVAAWLLVSALPGTVARAAAGQDLDALVFLGQGRGAFLAAVAAIAVTVALRPLLGPAAPARGAEEPREGGAGPRGLAPAYARTAAYAALVYGIVALGSSAQSFLYARF